MKFLIKIENKINEALLKLGSFILLLLKKLIPQKLSEFYFIKSQEIQGKITFLKRREFPKPKIDIKKKINALKAYQQELVNFLKESKNQKLFSRFKFLLKKPYLVYQTWSDALAPEHKFLLYSFTILSAISTFAILGNLSEIASNSSPGRKPASVKIDPYKRPDYYKQNTKEAVINNFKLPVYVEEAGKLKGVTVEFNILASNRFTRLYITKNEFAVRDYLISRIELLEASLPLSQEGKVIITNKIHQELNQFLKKRQVSGKVLSVHLVYVLAH